MNLRNLKISKVFRMPSIELVKSLSMIVMFLLTMILGNIPFRMKNFKENKKILA